MHQKRKNLLSIALLWLIAALVIGAMFAFYYTKVAPRPQPGQKTVTLELAYGNKTFTYEDIVTDADFVFDFLKEQNKPLNLRFIYQDSVYGPYVTGMMDVSEDKAKGYYYTYLINGEYAPLGISGQTIENGDRLRFEYGVQIYDDEYNTLSTQLKGAGKGANTITRKTLLITFIAAAVVMPLALIIYTALSLRKRRRNHESQS